MPRPIKRPMTLRAHKKTLAKLAARAYTAIDALRNAYDDMNLDVSDDKCADPDPDPEGNSYLSCAIDDLLEAQDDAEKCIKRL